MTPKAAKRLLCDIVRSPEVHLNQSDLFCLCLSDHFQAVIDFKPNSFSIWRLMLQRQEVKGRRCAEFTWNQRQDLGDAWRRSGLASSAPPSHVMPSRAINYWASQPERSLCVCVCAGIMPAFSSHVSGCHDNTVPRTERGAFGQTETENQTELHPFPPHYWFFF